MEEEVLGKAYDSRLMRRLLGYMRPYRAWWRVSLVFLLVQSVLQVLGPLLTKVAVDRYLAPDAGRTPTLLDAYLPADPWTGLTAVALLYLGVLVGTLRVRVRADLPDAVDRAARHVRPAPRS